MDDPGLREKLSANPLQNSSPKVGNLTEDELIYIQNRISAALEYRCLNTTREPISDFSRVVSLIAASQHVVVIIGAGGSVGPDFRSPGGLYDSIAKAGVLSDPYNVFDLDVYQQDPSIFWRFAHTIFPSKNPQHSAAHYFIQALEQRGKLLRVYSQNVDTLEIGVPDSKLRCVHGSWRESYCTSCGEMQDMEELRPFVESGCVPTCHKCGGLIRPGIVFFGQSVKLDDFEVYQDSQVADLLLVIGTSLQVAPISQLPNAMASVPSILINRSIVPCRFNAQLLGECDDVVKYLEKALGWRSDGEDKALEFYHPNTFVFPSNSELGARIVETSRETFLVTAATCNVSDME